MITAFRLILRNKIVALCTDYRNQTENSSDMKVIEQVGILISRISFLVYETEYVKHKIEKIIVAYLNSKLKVIKSK
jgi:hypothetical protein